MSHDLTGPQKFSISSSQVRLTLISMSLEIAQSRTPTSAGQGIHEAEASIRLVFLANVASSELPVLKVEKHHTNRLATFLHKLSRPFPTTTPLPFLVGFPKW